jgi:hypothetical protein
MHDELRAHIINESDNQLTYKMLYCQMTRPELSELHRPCSVQVCLVAGKEAAET